MFASGNLLKKFIKDSYMKNLLFTCLTFLFISSVFLSCRKEGFGGDTDLTVFVNHHGAPIAGAVVYVKFGATEFPGVESSNYDFSVICESEGSRSGQAIIKGLRKGSYYLYSIGWDKSINMGVKGGIPAEVKLKTGEMFLELPVSEEH
jgi:hypothetical protein